MKALILVGGYGTRLRPLTLSVPKPLIQFCNKSIVEHQIEALIKAGVDDVILAVAYQPHAMAEALTDLAKKYSIRITCSLEKEPLGTAGPIKLAEKLLLSGSDERDISPFFVCNSDIISSFPLKEMLQFHRSHCGEGTVLVTRVSDPTRFGVLVTDEKTHQVKNFVEKPKDNSFGNLVNAGLYILNPSVLKRIQLQPTSIEKEVFPSMAQDEALFCFEQPEGYWADIGQPEDFLRGQELHLNAQPADAVRPLLPSEARGSRIIPPVLMEPSVTVGKGCCIGPNVTLGSNCSIGNGVRIQDAALMDGVNIGNNTWIANSIVGWQSHIGNWVRSAFAVICDGSRGGPYSRGGGCYHKR